MTKTLVAMGIALSLVAGCKKDTQDIKKKAVDIAGKAMKCPDVKCAESVLEEFRAYASDKEKLDDSTVDYLFTSGPALIQRRIDELRR